MTVIGFLFTKFNFEKHGLYIYICFFLWTIQLITSILLFIISNKKLEIMIYWMLVCFYLNLYFKNLTMELSKNITSTLSKHFYITTLLAVFFLVLNRFVLIELNNKRSEGN